MAESVEDVEKETVLAAAWLVEKKSLLSKTKVIMTKYKAALTTTKKQEQEIQALKKQIDLLDAGAKANASPVVGDTMNEAVETIKTLERKLTEAKVTLKTKLAKEKEDKKAVLALENENSQLHWTVEDLKRQTVSAERECLQAKEESETLRVANEVHLEKIDELTLSLKDISDRYHSSVKLEEERHKELVSVREDFQKYRGRAQVALVAAQQDASTHANEALTTELSLVKKDLENTRSKLDGACVDLQLEQEEKDSLRTELLAALDQVKRANEMIAVEREAAAKEMKDKESMWEETIKKSEEDAKYIAEQHASELQAKGDAARGALDDSKRAMGLLRETITQKDQGIQSLQNQIEVLIEKLAFKTSKEEEANMEKKRKEEEINAIVRVALEQARRDALAVTAEQRISNLESKLRDSTDKCKILLQKAKEWKQKCETQKALSLKREEEYELRLKREIDLGDVDEALKLKTSREDGTTANETAVNRTVAESASPDVGVIAEAKTPNNRVHSTRDKQVLNAEYLKNCLVNFLCSKSIEEQKTLLPVIATILHFTTEELNDAKIALEIREGGLFGSALSLVSSFAAGSSSSGYTNFPGLRQ